MDHPVHSDHKDDSGVPLTPSNKTADKSGITSFDGHNFVPVKHGDGKPDGIFVDDDSGSNNVIGTKTSFSAMVGKVSLNTLRVIFAAGVAVVSSTLAVVATGVAVGAAKVATVSAKVAEDSATFALEKMENVSK
jgi:hypothetical protein